MSPHLTTTPKPLEHIQVPIGATRLLATPDSKKHSSEDIRPAPRIRTSLPHPSPPASPSTTAAGQMKRRPTMLSSAATSLASPTMSLIPQMLLSASLPAMAATPTSASGSAGASGSGSGTGGSPASGSLGGGGGHANPRRKLEPNRPVSLLSSKDPLSLPIMTTNFRRFIMVVGPVFWLQDRVEEILFWKTGWVRTAVWMCAYAFLCCYPRLILLLPHVVFIVGILATYPYPDASGQVPPPAPAAEGSALWQANIQGIQNLMGAFADAHDVIEPYMYHFVLTPAHLVPVSHPTSSTSTSSSTATTNTSSTPTPTPSTPLPPASAPPTASQPNINVPNTPRSPYTTHILTLLVLTFPLLAFLIHLPVFPLRQVCLLGGLAPFVCTHPYTLALAPVAGDAVRALGMVLVRWYAVALVRYASAVRYIREVGRKFGIVRLSTGSFSSSATTLDVDVLKRQGLPTPSPPLPIPPFPRLQTAVQRILDDDRLSDAAWNAEMRHVELWENERYGGAVGLLVPSAGGVGLGLGIGLGVGVGVGVGVGAGVGVGIAGANGASGVERRSASLERDGEVDGQSASGSGSATGSASTTTSPTSSTFPSASSTERERQRQAELEKQKQKQVQRQKQTEKDTLAAPVKGWSKANLRPGERAGWTRGRDGWSAVGGGSGSGGAGAGRGGGGSGHGHGSGYEGSESGGHGHGYDDGEVSSNLTFSLAPGWAFVETEDWRKDLGAGWAVEGSVGEGLVGEDGVGVGVEGGSEVVRRGGDYDGWVYTDDAWQRPRPEPYLAGGGSVTRRRRWVRRIWYDVSAA